MLPTAHEPPAGAAPLVEHLFRHQHAPILGALVRMLGPAHLALAEECVQDAFLRALQTWPFHGAPPNPAAWLTLVARRRALDHLRRARSQPPLSEPTAPPAHEPTLGDDTLELIFLCCHPSLPPDAQLALTLRSVAGLSTSEIARAFLTPEATIAQRIVRAKRAIQDGQLSFAVPFDAHLAPRLQAVCRVLYLMFNEGYSASSGDRLLREDLCHEAIRLVTLLTRNPATGRPSVHALAALFCLQAARLPARIDDAGDLLTLQFQDRSRWDPRLTAAGFHHLARSASGDEITPWHLEAEIASLHAVAPTFAATDWPHLAAAYEALSALQPSPVVTLARAVALSYAESPAAALALLAPLAAEPTLARYHLYPAILADLYARSGNAAAARIQLERALALAPTLPERNLLARRLAALL
jgi:RNA polymerase sigma-70 factor (ECF subfamily)